MQPLIFSAILGVCAAVWLLISRKRNQKLPPGPPGLPLIGNAFQIPTEKTWLTFAEWSKTYGDVMYLNLLGTPAIVLSSPEAVTELMDKRGAWFSDRPWLIFGSEMVELGRNIFMAPYGHRHREIRKSIISGIRNLEVFQAVQVEHVMKFLHHLQENPQDLDQHIERCIAAIIFKISHGYTLASEDPREDPIIKLMEESAAQFSEATTPGRWLVDLVPFLRWLPAWLPGMGFKETAKFYRDYMYLARDKPFDIVKDQMAKGTAVPSFTSKIIEDNPNPTPEEDDLQRFASGAFYSAGSHTTISALRSFFLAMTVYPDVQAKAQAELDKVTGPNRLPTFKDRSSLPYIEALIKEIYRWNPVGPLALPHRLTKDDVYKGYFLPKGSIVYANSWAIMHDPERYPSPEEFKPERYLQTQDDDSMNPDPRSFAFGYGRRVCPGLALADASIFIIVSMTLSVFKISPIVDPESGKEVVPVVDYTSGPISHPAPFKCDISVRAGGQGRLRS